MSVARCQAHGRAYNHIHMKYFKLFFVVLFVPLCGVFGSQLWLQNLTPAVTTINSATLNTTDGTAEKLLFAQRPARIWVSATSSATTGSLVIYFKTAADTNYWDSPAIQSNVKITMSAMSGATNTVSDWFETAGCEWIRVGAISNSCNAAVSGITIRIAAPRD